MRCTGQSAADTRLTVLGVFFFAWCIVYPYRWCATVTKTAARNGVRVGCGVGGITVAWFVQFLLLFFSCSKCCFFLVNIVFRSVSLACVLSRSFFRSLALMPLIFVVMLCGVLWRCPSVRETLGCLLMHFFAPICMFVRRASSSVECQRGENPLAVKKIISPSIFVLFLFFWLVVMKVAGLPSFASGAGERE